MRLETAVTTDSGPTGRPIDVSVKPRYRLEGDRFCIDVQLKSSRQLFDGRDPAPFRERDLDEDAVEYIAGAVHELLPSTRMKFVFWISEEPEPRLPAQEIVHAVRSHFDHEREQLDRQLRQHLRRGQLFLLVGLSVLVVFLSLAELTVVIPAVHVRQILREGLVIIGWVAMWRPLEVLLYDWWPLVQQRRLASRMVDVPVSVRYEQGPGTE
jgi:hypothetical protein